MRVYKAQIVGSDPFPVKAANLATAMRAAVRNKVTVSLATAEDLMEFGAKGIKLLVAGEESELQDGVTKGDDTSNEEAANDAPEEVARTTKAKSDA